MKKLIKRKVTQHILQIKCDCGRKTEFLVASGKANMTKKELNTNIPSVEWNGWFVGNDKELCPICYGEVRKEEIKKIKDFRI